MADPQLQKATEAGAQQQQQQAAQPKKEVTELLQKYGGFSAIKGMIPAAEDMNPTKKAIKDSFLKDSRKKAKRDSLKAELNAWLELLNEAQEVAEQVVPRIGFRPYGRIDGEALAGRSSKYD